MKIDLVGRLRNIQLPYTKVLLPLFEAVVNSIHSLEDANVENGRIDVFLKRGNLQTGLIEDFNFAPIEGFKVVDNGIGFDDKNFLSFQTSDTTFKVSKGIGRFLWLKAFNDVIIDSLYQQGNQFYHRTFNFGLSSDGICNHSNVPTEVRERKTTVELKGFYSKYHEKCPQKANLIARRIIEHCLIYFISPKPPSINVIDGKEVINLNEYFNEEIKPNSVHEKINFKSSEFNVISLKLYRSDNSEHRLHGSISLMQRV